MPVTAIALNCTLKSDPDQKSSTDAMIEVLRAPFEKAGRSPNSSGRTICGVALIGLSSMAAGKKRSIWRRRTKADAARILPSWCVENQSGL